jgi:hypothetical protein
MTQTIVGDVQSVTFSYQGHNLNGPDQVNIDLAFKGYFGLRELQKKILIPIRVTSGHVT